MHQQFHLLLHIHFFMTLTNRNKWVLPIAQRQLSKCGIFTCAGHYVAVTGAEWHSVLQSAWAEDIVLMRGGHVLDDFTHLKHLWRTSGQGLHSDLLKLAEGARGRELLPGTRVPLGVNIYKYSEIRTDGYTSSHILKLWGFFFICEFYIKIFKALKISLKNLS